MRKGLKSANNGLKKFLLANLTPIEWTMNLGRNSFNKRLNYSVVGGKLILKKIKKILL